jgi:hypothetical protein
MGSVDDRCVFCTHPIWRHDFDALLHGETEVPCQLCSDGYCHKDKKS